ncbi:hypothetical protein SAMN05421504_101785 [Amycolatopsis xylanica]|uniref:PknH-like extracellular domain-containing protein n=1 Tax=Amycolatopsis xylanica TaxID=589385 RepID=A0A1H2U4P3_9PSEU|nr:hypothetical protein SAMN05421504_101785 [Amycolatopsis xylanica]
MRIAAVFVVACALLAGGCKERLGGTAAPIAAEVPPSGIAQPMTSVEQFLRKLPSEAELKTIDPKLYQAGAPLPFMASENHKFRLVDACGSRQPSDDRMARSVGVAWNTPPGNFRGFSLRLTSYEGATGAQAVAEAKQALECGYYDVDWMGRYRISEETVPVAHGLDAQFLFTAQVEGTPNADFVAIVGRGNDAVVAKSSSDGSTSPGQARGCLLKLLVMIGESLNRR